MLTFLPLLSLFANIILQAVGAAGVLSPTIATLISGLVGNVTGLIPTLLSGEAKVQDALAVLAGLSSIIGTLQKDPNLPADQLTELNLLDGEVQAAIQAYLTAGEGFNASTYTPITPAS